MILNVTTHDSCCTWAQGYIYSPQKGQDKTGCGPVGGGGQAWAQLGWGLEGHGRDGKGGTPFYPRQELSLGIVVSGKKSCPSGGQMGGPAALLSIIMKNRKKSIFFCFRTRTSKRLHTYA